MQMLKDEHTTHSFLCFLPFRVAKDSTNHRQLPMRRLQGRRHNHLKANADVERLEISDAHRGDMRVA